MTNGQTRSSNWVSVDKTGPTCPEGEEPVRTHGRWLVPILVALAVLAAVRAVDWAQSNEDVQQLERDLSLHTGREAEEDSRSLARTLIGEGVPHEEAVDVAATLNYFGSDVLDYLPTARLLAAIEQSAPTTNVNPSRDVVRVAEQLEVDSEGLWSFLNLVVQESIERQMPADVTVEGLRVHGVEYAFGCELVEQEPCPVDVVVELVLDRQQGDYEQFGRIDCRLGTNAAHPACLAFADCAVEYAVVLDTHEAELDVWKTAEALGHEFGSAGWKEWTAATTGMAEWSWEAHETCITERYGVDPHKALVLAR